MSTAYKRLATADSIPKRHSRILHVKTLGIRAGQYDSIYRAIVKICQPVEVLLFYLYCGRYICTAIIRQDFFALFTHDRKEETWSNVEKNRAGGVP